MDRPKTTSCLSYLLVAIILSGCQISSNFSQLIKTDTATEKQSPGISPTKVPPNILLNGVASQEKSAGSSDTLNLVGHDNQVIDLAFSKDGSIIASASYDKTVRLWFIGTNKKPVVLRGHTKGVHSVTVSSKGKYIASGGWDRHIILWNAQTGAKLKKLRRHSKGISSLSFTPNGELLLSGDYGGRLNVWNVNSGKYLGALLGHKLAIRSVVVSPDNLTAASAGADGTIHIWDLQSLTEITKTKRQRGLIKALTFSPDGRMLYSGSSRDGIIIWNTADGSRIRNIGDFTGSINSLSLSPDGRKLVIAEGQKIHLLDTELEEIITTLQPHQDIVSSAIFSPKGNLIGSASVDNSVKLWRPPSGVITAKEGRLISYDSTVNLTGSVSDTDALTTVSLNGRPLNIRTDGSFNISKDILVGENKFTLLAVDEQGNESEYTLIVERQRQEIKTPILPEITRPQQQRKQNRNRIAVIIGIENYQFVPVAKYAENDSRMFYEFATHILAIPPNQIQYIYGKDATRANILKAFSNWMKSFSNNQQLEVFVFYSGHGLSEADGSEAYFLPVDGDPALLRDTAISRKRVLIELANIAAKSATLFLDTCYSGVTRNGDTIVSGQRPVVITPTGWQGIAPNVSILAASSQSETSTGLDERKHGIFSYFLMRALNGEADLKPKGNEDGTITLQEIIDFVRPNVIRTASGKGQKQTPQLLGASKTVISQE